MALLSALDRALPKDVVVFGEVGLAVSIHSVPAEERLNEAFKHGFKRARYLLRTGHKGGIPGMQIHVKKLLQRQPMLFDEL